MSSLPTMAISRTVHDSNMQRNPQIAELLIQEQHKLNGQQADMFTDLTNLQRGLLFPPIGPDGEMCKLSLALDIYELGTFYEADVDWYCQITTRVGFTVPVEFLCHTGRSAAALKAEGNRLFGQAKYELAFGRYQAAIMMDNSNPKYFGNLALCCRKLAMYGHMAVISQECIARHPKFAKGYCNLAWVLKEQNRLTACMATLKEGLGTRPCRGNLRDLLRLKAEAEALTHDEGTDVHKPVGFGRP